MAILTPINLNNLELFTARYLSHYLTNQVPSFHREWTRELVGQERYLYFEAMRGGAKSTVCDVTNGVHQGLESKNPELHIISQSGGSTGLSTKIMRQIKREFETNIVLQDDYKYRQGKP
jgi:hypothetical protein